MSIKLNFINDSNPNTSQTFQLEYESIDKLP